VRVGEEAGCLKADWKMTGVKEKDLSIFLLMGQSNMAGRGQLGEVEPVEDPRVLMFREGGWSVAREPLHDDKPTAGVGLGMTFALGLLEEWPSARIGLVPCAVGGSPLELWEPGACLYSVALEGASSAARSGEIKGVLWHQGESDSDELAKARTYCDRYAAAMTAFREALGIDDVPVIVGQLGEFLRSHERLVHADIVDEALIKAADGFPLGGFVASGGLTDNGDNVHFNAKSLREFGFRYSSVYRTIAREGGVELISVKARSTS
jgi:hypothetical protein